ncbi:MAG: SIS domain-containing protein [bacterium]
MILDDICTWPKKLKTGVELAESFYEVQGDLLPKNIKNVVFLGMGGSGIVGRMIKTFLDKQTQVRCDIIDSPEVPGHVQNDGQTLAFAITYSGNTWETLAGLKQVLDRSVPVIVIAHAGRAQELARQNNLPFIELPVSEQPRSALGNFLGLMLVLFDLMGVLRGKKLVADFIVHAEKNISIFANPGFFGDFLHIVKNLPFFHIWGVSGESGAFAYRAQTQFNENSKIQAIYSTFPELAHNLLVGFTDIQEKTGVLLFYTDFVSKNTQKAIEAMVEILREKGADLYKVPVLGDTFEVQLFNMVLWADFASCHLGLVRGVELTQVEIIERLKLVQKQKGITV